jgi:hypothetical protein
VNKPRIPTRRHQVNARRPTDRPSDAPYCPTDPTDLVIWSSATPDQSGTWWCLNCTHAVTGEPPTQARQRP